MKYSIIGRSINNESALSEQPLEILVQPVYGFKLTPQVLRTTLIQQDKNSDIDTEFKITNTGNDIDWYDITYESEHDWILIPYTQRRLAPGATERLSINLESPWLRDAGEYQFTIICTSNSKPELVRTLELIVVIQTFDIQVTELYVGDTPLHEAEISEGETVIIRAKLENVGNINFSSDTFGDELIIKFFEESGYIGEVNITYLPYVNNSHNNTAWVSVLWRISKAQEYSLCVEIDPNYELPDFNRDNNIVYS